MTSLTLLRVEQGYDNPTCHINANYIFWSRSSCCWKLDDNFYLGVVLEGIKIEKKKYLASKNENLTLKTRGHEFSERLF